jgi:mono/diheme cytochrome c family protein
MRRGVLAGIAIVATAAGVVLLIFVNGAYNVAATAQHTAPVYALLDYASRRAIAWRAGGIEAPAVPAATARGRGLQLYREHWVQSHGAPGVAPSPFALGLTPLPANLALQAGERDPAVIYWTIRYGLKMTAMPAWEFRLNDADLWAVTAFVGMLATLSPVEYRELAAQVEMGATASLSAERPTPEPDAERGKLALQQHACPTCHEIPGVVGAHAPVGPSLAGVGSRRYIAGILPNTLENMVTWLRSPQSIEPRTAMPDLFVSPRDARDIAAFLGTLR